ncbi:MAG TPA: hypothetical protein VEZ48_09825 [Sphingomonadaceae bacterium]|nr:hypothetical protein [Sphingomonadaceae bacterium]
MVTASRGLLMQIKYIDPTEFDVVEVRRASPGAILFQSTYEQAHEPRLIASAPDQNDDDDGLPRTVYVKLTAGAPGYQYNEANLSDVELAVTGWQVEVDPASVKSTSAGRPRAGDIILHQGAMTLVVWDNSGRPFSLNLNDFRLGPPVRDNVTTTFFAGWRIVKYVVGRENPIVVFERAAGPIQPV